MRSCVGSHAVLCFRLLLQYGGRSLLSARCKFGRLPLECATSAEMTDLLTQPPSSHLSSPTKRKYAHIMTDSQVRHVVVTLFIGICLLRNSYF